MKIDNTAGDDDRDNPWLDRSRAPKSAVQPDISYTLRYFEDSSRKMRQSEEEWPYRPDPHNDSRVHFYYFRGVGDPPSDVSYVGDVYIMDDVDVWVCQGTLPDPQQRRWTYYTHIIRAMLEAERGSIANKPSQKRKMDVDTDDSDGNANDDADNDGQDSDDEYDVEMQNKFQTEKHNLAETRRAFDEFKQLREHADQNLRNKIVELEAKNQRLRTEKDATEKSTSDLRRQVAHLTAYNNRINTHLSAMIDLRTASMGGTNDASGSGVNDFDSLY
ncbi:hypothetical protein PLEOSDRAFT_170163 [Pleurotus ostreatus PC15]|uniref:Uncharacterized protein n=1 Tax=Pleurotus ostreatus (strain PC15) TaxID=1137138 RepID=A0A067NLC4_PLEO1|nr:hypothetical protein PLEOSDRAFT_170163 [Pleurotus ostreatus PC15]